MEDDNMVIVDGEGKCHRKITRVNAGEGVVKEFIQAGGIVKWRNLEDQGNETTKGRHRGVAGRGGENLSLQARWSGQSTTSWLESLAGSKTKGRVNDDDQNNRA